MSTKTCFFTGRVDVNSHNHKIIKDALMLEIVSLINNGFSNFACRMLNNADYIFADIVAELKAKYNITLEAVFPYRNLFYKRNKTLQRLIGQINFLWVFSEKYSKASCINCSKKMILACECSIIIKSDAKKLYYEKIINDKSSVRLSKSIVVIA